MSDKKQEVLLGEALEGLKTHHGYRALIEIFQNLYNNAVEKLIEAEDVNARATIKALQDIVSIIDDKIDLGREAREILRKEMFKKHQMRDTGY
jgi:hypothetical protein